MDKKIIKIYLTVINIRNRNRVRIDPTYACIYVEEFESDFLNLQTDKALVFLSFIDDILFVLAHGRREF